MVCPFCGVDSETPHDTQEACIEALRAEILRVRGVLDGVRSLEGPWTLPLEGTAEEEKSAV